MHGCAHKCASAGLLGAAGALASAQADHSVIVWLPGDTADPFAVLKGHAEKVESVVWLNSSVLASGSSDSTVRIWAPFETEEPIVTLANHSAQVRLGELAHHFLSMACLSQVTSMAQWMLSAIWPCSKPAPNKNKSADGLWAVIQIGLQVKSVVWLNGTVLASGSSDSTIRIWAPFETGEPIITLNNHTAQVTSISGNSKAPCLRVGVGTAP